MKKVIDFLKSEVVIFLVLLICAGFVGNYIDRAFSAKTDNRPEFQKMIKDSYKHCFDMIIV